MVSIIQKPVNFIREVRQELGKVAWSSRNELMGATVVVMVITAIMAVFIGMIDLVLSKILTIVFK
jgi:preprotein translocase subunit SecE